jgi:hypothetical protein
MQLRGKLVTLRLLRVEKEEEENWLRYEIAELSEIESIQLHVFCDASEIGPE